MIASINVTTRRYTARLAGGNRTVNVTRPGSPVVRVVGVQGPAGTSAVSGDFFAVMNRLSELSSPAAKAQARTNLEVEVIDCGTFN